jgi:hypothetical protein
VALELDSGYIDLAAAANDGVSGATGVPLGVRRQSCGFGLE